MSLYTDYGTSCSGEFGKRLCKVEGGIIYNKNYHYIELSACE